jgi:hypothetical protein
MIKELEDSSYFKQWLFNKQTNEIIGESGTCTNCPIANFLKDNGYSKVYVGSHAYSLEADYSDTEKWEQHTEWMKSFIYRVETVSKDEKSNIQVTKELALSLLGDL